MKDIECTGRIMTPDIDPNLIEFVQRQVSRENCWCWETIFERVAEALPIQLDADRLIYAGGTIRTGRYEFRCNDAPWRAWCKRIQESPDDAAELVREVISALTSPHATGAAQAWLDQRLIEASRLPHDVRGLVGRLLSWQGYVYRKGRGYARELATTHNVIYGLWRLDDSEQAIAPLPLNIGETKGTWLHKRSRDHCNWWGDKPIGITLVHVQYDDSQRKKVERVLQDALVPLANTDRSRLDLLKRVWNFPRP